MAEKLTTTPTPLELVGTVNDIIDDKLDITGTAAAASTLTGLTATVAELNTMDGVTATAAEINKLNGLTATTTELNYVAGATSNIQTQLDGKLSTSGKAASATTADSAGNVTGTVAVTNGGTGATTAAAACTNLGIFNSAGHLVLPNGSELWVE